MASIWYTAVMREAFSGFKKGQLVYVRPAVTKQPLAVGPVHIIFDGSGKAVKVVEALTTVFARSEASRDSRAISNSYRRFLERNPPALRYTANEYLYILP